MRVNIYAEEMTDKVELIEKTTKDGTFVGLRFWLELPVTVPAKHTQLSAAPVMGLGPEDYEPQHVSGPFMHGPDDNDSAAVTFWGKAQLKVALKKALKLLEDHQ